jgi:single-strand selective monofunctional uracil DNA glycosylase
MPVAAPAKRLIAIQDALAEEVDQLSFGGPVTHVYNPLRYARDLASAYLQRYGQGRKRVVFMGMNPGPYGMVQTGVPFGEVATVRDWMGLAGSVSQPQTVHPKRPIQGLTCGRSEVSGRRLWGTFAERFGRPEDFFAEHMVFNFCPLAFMQTSGANLTPDKLSAEERTSLFASCDRALRAMVQEWRPQYLVGVGRFARERLEAAFPDAGAQHLIIGQVLHPSPASPVANRGWGAAATRQLVEQGIWE